MTLLETASEAIPTVEIPADVNMPWWAWLGVSVAVMIGAFLGHKVGVRKAAKAAATTTGLLVLSLGLSGCFESVPKTWVEADRATYDLVVPEYKAYVEADPKLTENQKGLRKSAMDTWKLRLETNEKAVK